MPVQFSRHALEKMLLRKVKKAYVYETLKFPDEVYEDVEHGVMIAVKKWKLKQLRLYALLHH